MSKVAVSIICNTYNQEAYIEDAIQGFLMQKTDFPFEVLIHDDASTDQTARIIRKYEEKYPEIIKPIYQKENQYSQHISIVKKYQLPRASGEFIAFCEGDDYWTDEEKLKKQVDALRRHPETDICGHKARKESKEGFAGYVAPRDKNEIIPIEEIIRNGGGQYIATASLMIRRDAICQKTPMMDIISLDYVWQLQGALRGGLVYLNDEMSVYRVMSNGSWTIRMKGQTKTRNAHSDRVMNMLKAFDEYTNHRYTETVHQAIGNIEYKQLLRAGDYTALTSEKYRDIFRRKPLKHRIWVYAKCIEGRMKHSKNGQDKQ